MIARNFKLSGRNDPASRQVSQPALQRRDRSATAEGPLTTSGTDSDEQEQLSHSAHADILRAVQKGYSKADCSV